LIHKVIIIFIFTGGVSYYILLWMIQKMTVQVSINSHFTAVDVHVF